MHPYPSCPKSSVNFCNLVRSSSFTVRLLFASDRSMSFWSTVNNVALMIASTLMPHHSNNRLFELIFWHIHPTHGRGTGVSRRAWFEQIVDDKCCVFRWWARDALKMCRLLHFAHGLHKSIAYDNRDIGAGITAKRECIARAKHFALLPISALSQLAKICFFEIVRRIA